MPGDGEAGGDWLDVVTLPDGRILVALGHVIGHGTRAADFAARLRHTARGYAEDGWSPAAVLRRLDRCAAACSATALVATIDPAHETRTYARAGHIPPVLRMPDGSTRLLEDGVGPMLADSRLPHPGDHGAVPGRGDAGDVFDGLVERRGESIDAGLARVRAAVDRSGGVPEELVAAVPAVLDSVESRDGVALVAVQTAAC